MKILTIGGATQDVFIVYEDAESLRLRTQYETKSYLLLKEGSKIEVKELLYSTGGGANNTAISYARLGFNVSTFLKIGDDEAGTFILKQLNKEGIKTDLIVTAQGQTGLSFIVPSLEHDRTIFAFRGVNGTLQESDVPFDKIKNYDYVYVTSLSGQSSSILLPLCMQAKEHNIPIATNPGASQLVAGAPILCQSLPYIDTLILNSSEAKHLMLSLVQTGRHIPSELASQEQQSKKPLRPTLLEESINVEDVWFSLSNFFQAVFSHGPSIVVVTNGAEGVYVATPQTIYFHPALTKKAVNTLEAGDAFG